MQILLPYLTLHFADFNYKATMLQGYNVASKVSAFSDGSLVMFRLARTCCLCSPKLIDVAKPKLYSI